MNPNKPYPAQRAVLRNGQWVTEIAPQDDGAERVRQAKAALRAWHIGSSQACEPEMRLVKSETSADLMVELKYGTCDCGVEGCEGRPEPVKAKALLPVVPLKVGGRYELGNGEIIEGLRFSAGGTFVHCSDGLGRFADTGRRRALDLSTDTLLSVVREVPDATAVKAPLVLKVGKSYKTRAGKEISVVSQFTPEWFLCSDKELRLDNGSCGQFPNDGFDAIEELP